MVGKRRKFNGKLYGLEETFRTKREALKYARRVRKEGDLARVTRYEDREFRLGGFRHRWAIWTRKRGRK